MSRYPNVSLRKLAKTCEISYRWVLKCGKTPIDGSIFNPKVINYNKIASILLKHGIHLEDLDWETLNKTAVDINDFQVGDKVYLRKTNETQFEIVYKTDTHIVIMKDGSTEPHALRNSTFLEKGPSFNQHTKIQEEKQ